MRGVGQHAEHLADDLDVGAVGVAGTHWVGVGHIAAVNSPGQQTCRPPTLVKPPSLAHVQSDFGGMPEGTVAVPGLSDGISAG